MNEVNVEWRDVVGYEGYYEVSNKGQVRRKGKKVCLKPRKTRDGYLDVSLCVKCEARHHRVSRLVAQAFIPNPDNLPVVDHIDRVRDNNCVENLRWATWK